MWQSFLPVFEFLLDDLKPVWFPVLQRNISWMQLPSGDEGHPFTHIGQWENTKPYNTSHVHPLTPSITCCIYSMQEDVLQLILNKAINKCNCLPLRIQYTRAGSEANWLLGSKLWLFLSDIWVIRRKKKKTGISIGILTTCSLAVSICLFFKMYTKSDIPSAAR